MRRTHPLIVGGGPAGAMAAIRLAQAGEQALLLERTTGPQDVVCGGFLSSDTLAMLESVGIDAFAFGGRRVTQLRLVAGQRTTLIDLPFLAAGLSRRTLDAALLSRVETVERGVTVRAIDPAEPVARLADGTAIAAPAIFLATGKHDLRGAGREASPGDDPSVGMRVRLAPSPALQSALAGRIELILLDHGYAGLVLHEDGSANLCFTIAQSRLEAASGNRTQLLEELAAEAPVLSDRIGQANGLGDWASVARVPYGWRTDTTRPGLFRLGDQAAVIASLAGDGIAIALKSGAMAADHYMRGGADSAIGFQRNFAKAARRPLQVADGLRALAESSGLASFGIRALGAFPAAARIATRATRIGAY
jgi:flavin-dependent dehydrogenase